MICQNKSHRAIYFSKEVLPIPDIRERKRDIKTRDRVEKKKNKRRAGKLLAGRKLTAKFREELARQGKDWETPEGLAADETAQAAGAAFEKVLGTAETGIKQVRTIQREKRRKKEAEARRRTERTAPPNGSTPNSAPPAPSGANDPTGLTPPAPGERMRQAAIREKRPQAASPTNQQAGSPTARSGLSRSVQNNSSPSNPSIYPSTQTAPAQRGGRPFFRERAQAAGTAPKKKTALAIKTRQGTARAGKKAAAPGGSALTQAQERMKSAAQRRLAAQTKQTARTAVEVSRRLAVAVAKAVAAVVSAIAGLAGGAILLAALCVVILVAAVVASPFGILFSDQHREPGAVSPNAAVAQINVEYAARLEELQAGDYDSIQLQGQPPDWKQVLAVFASRTAGVDDGTDVTVLDQDRVERLRAVFWDMTVISSEVETIDHPGSDDSEGWTEHILHITVKAKTPDDMRVYYQFSGYQNEAMDELLKELDALGGLLGDLSIIQADAVELLQSLPEDLSPERRAVVRHALSLVGKVNYFWGGKSLAIGWDSRWGTTMEVTAAGSSTTGTFRPYGLDCSGYADWVFFNASGGDYIIGHGGGAHAQHTYCTDISWDEALPGDLVFYPEDTHVGIVGGRDEAGNLLIIHCASGANNVVITGLSGFTSIGRPLYFGD